MERIIFRIVLEEVTLKDAADIKEKMTKILEAYGKYEFEISSITLPTKG